VLLGGVDVVGFDEPELPDEHAVATTARTTTIATLVV
jgi:hypothetical protein